MPHVKTALIRVLGQHATDRNNCLIVAFERLLSPLHPVFNYETIDRILSEAGRKRHHRFCIRKAVLAMRHSTKLVFQPIQIPAPWITTRTFARLHPKGHFLIRTGGHAMACIHGMFHDTSPVSDRLHVTHAWKCPSQIDPDFSEDLRSVQHTELLQFLAQCRHPHSLVAG